jgi:hypothetical protein
MNASALDSRPRSSTVSASRLTCTPNSSPSRTEASGTFSVRLECRYITSPTSFPQNVSLHKRTSKKSSSVHSGPCESADVATQ